MSLVAPLAAFAGLLAVSAAAVWWFYRNGYTLYFGDAQAHLAIARRILDSRNPGYEQIGTVWLPLPHALMLPFAGNDWLWRTGLAGAIPSAVFFVLAGMFLFGAVRRITGSSAAGAAGAALLALNPNVLYLQSIPMTEMVFFGSLLGTLYFTIRFAQGPSLLFSAAAGFFCLLGTLTRYEGWFLIPFFALALLLAGQKRRAAAALLFCIVAAAGPLYWLAHNTWYYSNPLEFYSGPYSAKAIYQRALDQGLERYPGDGDLPKAFLQYKAAAGLCAGLPLLLLAAAGIPVAIFKRGWWCLLVLLLPSVFYIWSIYSSGTPIFVPNRWPNSYYNTRYGLVVIPAAAFAAGTLALLSPQRWRGAAAVVIVLAGVSPWIAYPRMEGWVCWKESQVNSEARRAWTAETAAYLRAHYRDGDGVLTSFGDLAGVFREAGIPLRQTLHQGNNPLWQASLNRPDLFLWQKWVVAIGGDEVATAMTKNEAKAPRYRCVKMVEVKGAPAILIYERQHP